MTYWLYTNKSDRVVQLRLDDRGPQIFEVGPKEDTVFEASATEDASIWVSHGNNQSHACVTRGVVAGLCEEISEDVARQRGIA